eukprot:2550813-Rhodomonas_salina.8
MPQTQRAPPKPGANSSQISTSNRQISTNAAKSVPNMAHQYPAPSSMSADSDRKSPLSHEDKDNRHPRLY